LSARVDFNGLTAGASYTFTVTATNAQGVGAASAASNAVTPLTFGPLWVANGGAVTGENPAYGDGSFSGTAHWSTTPGSLAQNDSGFTAPTPLTSGTNVTEFDGTAFGAIQSYVKHINPQNDGNGRLNLVPYTYVTVSVWPTVDNQTLSLSFEGALWYNGVTTGGSGIVSTVTDSSQDWVANQFASGWAFNDNSIGLPQAGITANTTDTVTFQSGGASLAVGDYYEIQGPGDGIGQAVWLPDAAYGPAAMTSGAWNTYSVPLTAFDTATPNVSQAFVIQFGIQDQTGNADNTLYFCNMGYN
jgi:hypothetical protein